MMDWRDAYWETAAPVLPPAGSAPSVLQPAGGAVQVLCPPPWYSSSSVQPVQLLAPATSLASSLPLAAPTASAAAASPPASTSPARAPRRAPRGTQVGQLGAAAGTQVVAQSPPRVARRPRRTAVQQQKRGRAPTAGETRRQRPRPGNQYRFCEWCVSLSLSHARPMCYIAIFYSLGFFQNSLERSRMQ